MRSWLKYAIVAGGAVMGTAYYLPASTFLAFLTVWLLLIPAAAIVYLACGLREYIKNRRNRIMVSIKPGEAMMALARREALLRKEKEILYKELRNEERRR
ncbi:MAG: hypothetical protein M5U10_00955 [Candidatus Methanoperedens sp.]|nr:hypothetical protein [Candidatus Methanoperedens nitroreducens]MDJ1420461.1 hypothetical protein [Candidatus Methanoperedens sp.]